MTCFEKQSRVGVSKDAGGARADKLTGGKKKKEVLQKKKGEADPGDPGIYQEKPGSQPDQKTGTESATPNQRTKERGGGKTACS